MKPPRTLSDHPEGSLLNSTQTSATCQPQPPICARFARMRWTLPQALRAMETDGWTRGGVATYAAMCA